MARQRLTSIQDLPAANQQLAEDIAAKLRLKSGPLATVAHRARHKLPSRLVVGLSDAIQAETWVAHPKFRTRVDLPYLRDLHAQTRAHLASVNLQRARERYWLGLAAGFAVNMTLLAAAIALVIHWRGL